MTFNNAKGLHNEDEVTIKETGEIVTILQAYPSENGKYIVLECDNGNTYYNDEVKWNDDLLRREVNNMKASKVNAINKIAIKGDRNEPVIAAIQNIKINHPELYKELSKVIDVELWDGYSLMIHEEIE